MFPPPSRSLPPQQQPFGRCFPGKRRPTRVAVVVKLAASLGRRIKGGIWVAAARHEEGEGRRLGLGVFQVEVMMNRVGFRPIKESKSGWDQVGF
jgi:hypothetical protein